MWKNCQKKQFPIKSFFLISNVIYGFLKNNITKTIITNDPRSPNKRYHGTISECIECHRVTPSWMEILLAVCNSYFIQVSSDLLFAKHVIDTQMFLYMLGLVCYIICVLSWVTWIDGSQSSDHHLSCLRSFIVVVTCQIGAGYGPVELGKLYRPATWHRWYHTSAVIGTMYAFERYRQLICL